MSFKREWFTRSGKKRIAWKFEYRDADGNRCTESYKTKAEADAAEDKIKAKANSGINIAAGKRTTVAQAGADWIRAAEADGLERATLDQYRQHLNFHIAPFIGKNKLPNLGIPTIRKFEERLLEEGRSRVMVRKVLASLGAILADAQEQGLIASNPVRDLRRNRRRGEKAKKVNGRKKLKVGEDIPWPHEVRDMIAGATTPRWRALLITTAFTGLRASEIRGLRWTDVNLKGGELHVRQRADRYNEIGEPKSDASSRTLPLPQFVVNTLKEWKLACPKSKLNLVFPNGAGNVESLGNIINRGLIPAQGDKPKYTGLHSLRHFYASWCINRVKNGGLGLPPKDVQVRMGHSSIVITLDLYGHLFAGDDAGEMDDAVNALLA